MFGNFYPKIVLFMLRNAETYGRAVQVADDKVIRRMHVACLIPKATNVHSDYVTLVAFYRQS